MLRALLTPLQLLPVLLAAALMAAHFMRAGEPGLALTSALSPWLLVTRRRWAARALQLLLLGGGLIWLQTLLGLVQLRLTLGQPYLRLAIILGAVMPVSFLVLQKIPATEQFTERIGPYVWGVATYLAVAIAMIAGSLLKPRVVEERSH